MKKHVITFSKKTEEYLLKAKILNPDGSVLKIEDIANLGKNQQVAEDKAFDITKERIVYNSSPKEANPNNGNATFKDGEHKGKRVADTPITYIVDRFIRTTYANSIKRADVDLMCAYDYLVKENKETLETYLRTFLEATDDRRLKDLFNKYENCLDLKAIDFPYSPQQEQAENLLLGHIIAPLCLEEIKKRNIE
jgi:hypothetical protein